MKDKDTILLEEAYTNIREGLFDKIGNPKMYAIAPILKTNPIQFSPFARTDIEIKYDVFSGEAYVAHHKQTGTWQIEDIDNIHRTALLDYIKSNKDKIFVQEDTKYDFYIFASIYGKKKNIQRYVQEYLKSEIIVLVSDDGMYNTKN